MQAADGNMEERIEQYLAGNMPEQERIAFEREVEADPVLQEEVHFQRSLIGAIRFARHEELKEFLRTETAKQKHKRSSFYYIISIAAMLVLAFGFAFFYLKNDTAQTAEYTEDAGSYYEELAHHTTDTLYVAVPPGAGPAPERMASTMDNVAQDAGTFKAPGEEPLTMEWREDLATTDVEMLDTIKGFTYNYNTAPAKTKDFGVPNGQGSVSPAYAPPPTNTYRNLNLDIMTDSIAVAVDRKIKDTSITVLAFADEIKKGELTEISVKQQSTANADLYKKEKRQRTRDDESTRARKEADKKKEDASQAAKPEKKQEVQKTPALVKSTWDNPVTIEYWTSPINFRGYKFYRNKLVLFGIAPAEKIQVINYQGAYYLKTAKQLYKLEEHEEFNSFKPVEDQALRRKFGL